MSSVAGTNKGAGMLDENEWSMRRGEVVVEVYDVSRQPQPTKQGQPTTIVNDTFKPLFQKETQEPSVRIPCNSRNELLEGQTDRSHSI